MRASHKKTRRYKDMAVARCKTVSVTNLNYDEELLTIELPYRML